MKTSKSRALGETFFILSTWCIFCAWVIFYCAGHYLPTDEPQVAADVAVPILTVAGLPVWVFWGIAVPWAVASVVTIAFALFGLSEEGDTDA